MRLTATVCHLDRLSNVVTHYHCCRVFAGGLKMKYDVNAYCSSYSSTYCNGLTVYIDNQVHLGIVFSCWVLSSVVQL